MKLRSRIEDLLIAHYYDGPGASFSIAAITEELGYSPGSSGPIRREIRKLEEEGLIATGPRRAILRLDGVQVGSVETYHWKDLSSDPFAA